MKKKDQPASRELRASGSGDMAPWAPLNLRSDYAKAVAGTTYNKAYDIKRRPRASNSQRYPLPCSTHFGNLKCAQQDNVYC